MIHWRSAVGRLAAFIACCCLFVSPCDADQPADGGLVSHRYQVIENCNVVLDLRTRLMWQRCSLGQLWNGQVCVGRPVKHDWSAASQLQSQLCGYSDWSLPAYSDLEGLLQDEGIPAIDTVVFPNTPPASYWSASGYEGDARQAWYVNFGKGGGQHTFKDSSFFVRLVRLAQ
jgi:hypothetical protein